MNDPQYSNRTVALLDCLGFKNLIQSSVTDTVLLKRIYSMQSLFGFNNRVGKPESVDFKFSQFSDSIIMSANDSISGIWTILLACRSFYHTAVGHGIFMRGGLSIGKLLHEGNVVFGPALVEVAELEKSVAIYPRLVLSRSILDEMTQKEEFWSRNYRDLYIKTDDDAYCFLEIFDHPANEQNTKLMLDTKEGREHFIAYFHRLVTQVDEEIAQAPDARVRAKYVWFGRKLNEYLRVAIKVLPGERIALVQGCEVSRVA